MERIRLSSITGALSALTVLALAACGPVSPEVAAQRCEDRARAAAGPTGELRLGAGSEGFHSGIEVGITSDFLMGRDPYLVYESCVYNMTGQGPIRPLIL